MVASSKRLIPVELLRRSARRSCKKDDSPLNCDDGKSASSMVIKQENLIPTKDTDNLASNQSLSFKPVSTKLEPDLQSKHCQFITPAGSKEYYKLYPDGYLLVNEEELDLERTLLGGQSFRWTKQINYFDSKEEQTSFTGTVANNVFQLWRCDNERIAYRKLNIEPISGQSSIEELLTDYFQLKYKLRDLYEYWSKKDDNFRECSQHYEGFRILRQDPVENVFSFICATNNNIKRISLMVCSLCRRFGSELVLKETKTTTKVSLNEDGFFSFPTVERLAQDDVFNVLRYELGFGYRAKFICETAKKLMSISSSLKASESPRDYLISLRQAPYKETCKQLQEFPGIGRKVADCICLMSMDHLNSVPIDCHIYEIVCRNYMKTLRQERKTLTEKVHDMIGDYFVDLHGPLAGWATSVLFVGELKHLKRVSNVKSEKANKKTKTQTQKKTDCEKQL